MKGVSWRYFLPTLQERFFLVDSLGFTLLSQRNECLEGSYNWLLRRFFVSEIEHADQSPQTDPASGLEESLATTQGSAAVELRTATQTAAAVDDIPFASFAGIDDEFQTELSGASTSVSNTADPVSDKFARAAGEMANLAQDIFRNG